MPEKQWSMACGRLEFLLARQVGFPAERETDGKHSRRLSTRVNNAVALFVASLVLSACAGQPVNTAPPHSAAKINAPSASSAEVARTVVTPEATTDIPELFEKATAQGQSKQYELAASSFERAFQLDPDGPLADRSLFESAEMYDLAGKHEAALARYEQVARRFPKSELDRVARVRALRLLIYLEQYARGGELAESTAAKYQDLLSFEQLAVLSARALSR